MLVKKYISEIVSIQNKIRGIYTLEFKSLSGRYRYSPGQFLHLAIDPDYDGSGQWPESRCFSMQSSPEEEVIRISYSVKGTFTTQMEKELQVGSKVWLKLPFGDIFMRQHNKNKSVFIAGGTGVTPFLSLFTHSSFKDYTDPVIYLGFKTKGYNVYENELSCVKSGNINIFYEESDGFLNIEYILTENGTAKDYFISGPPVMIRRFKEFLLSRGVSSNQLFLDEWS